MSTPAEAVAPKRQRGRDRVEAILEAASELFHEKSYDAVTMTEIAARAGAAIGSLYRFFPTKEAVATALLERYGARLIAALDDLIERSQAGDPAAAAQGLLRVLHGLRRDRSVALALIDAEAELLRARPSIRSAMTERMARLIDRLGGAATFEQATVLRHLVKSVSGLPQKDDGLAGAFEAEAQAVLLAYLQRVCASELAGAPGS